MALGFWGFLFWIFKNAGPTQGFEHVKGYAGSLVGKGRGCSKDVCLNMFLFKRYLGLDIVLDVSAILLAPFAEEERHDGKTTLDVWR